MKRKSPAAWSKVERAMKRLKGTVRSMPTGQFMQLIEELGFFKAEHVRD